MKRKGIEVKLSLPVVVPLLDVVRELAGELRRSLAAPPVLPDIDAEFRMAWEDELLAGQGEDLKALLSVFGSEFFAEGVVAFDEGNAEAIVRACTAVRLRLRDRRLRALGDETLETGDVDLAKLDEPLRKAFMSYLFLATLQELIIQHFDSIIIGP